MEQITEPLVIGVRFSKVGKIYHFVADTVTDIKVSDMVVVETSRGWQLGQVAQIIPDADPPPEGWKPIDRRATPRDLLMRQMWQMKEAEVVNNCRDRASTLNLIGIKIVSAEYSFDGSRLTILFSSETEEKYELKSLRSDMQKMFAPSQVEMRQVGPRDVAKVMCGMGACGLETRCCCLFLTEFSSISIRMAKEQGISLTPTEITGMCGRLRCCLVYEYDNYVEARSKLPKRNKRVRTPQGEGKVVDVVPLRGAVIVELPELGHREFPGSEIQVIDGEGSQPTGTVFTGPQRASEIDSARTGDERQEPFEVSTENPPKVNEPRSMPQPGSRPEQRPEQASRSGEPRRGRRDNPPNREQPSDKTQAEQRGPRPAGKQRKGAPGSRPHPGGKVQPKEGPPTQQNGEQPRPNNESRGPSQKGMKDHRRRKGPRRDNIDNES
jgi:cell fate regulator YaaT (PSP1 superfamily)